MTHFGFLALAGPCILVVLQGCAQLPPLTGRTVTTAAHDTTDTLLGRSAAPLISANPGKSGVLALRDGRNAFAARLLLADAAERTLDVQYYIWRRDLSGTMLLDALQRAADRGVRVRLLLDDNNTGDALDDALVTLNAHPNIEVRLFNPFVGRHWRALDWLIDFARLNRRMHNKSFTIDNQATVVGGRNVGDEYFDAGEEVLFVDLDVLAIGPVVGDVSTDFDRYWESESAYPVDRLLPKASPAKMAEVNAATERVVRGVAAARYGAVVARSPFVHDLVAGRLDFDWAAVQLVSDDPDKALGHATKDDLLWPRLKQALGKPTRDLVLVSPYFVPGAQGVVDLSAMARGGVAISVLTNSLEATDVPAVHAGYAKRRKALLEAGVVLYEMKLTSSLPAAPRVSGPVGSRGSSGSSLHAKTFAVDGAHVFIGSFNFDPRSARLNTEMGLVIDSEPLARSIEGAFTGAIPQRAYRVRLAPGGSLQWVEELGGRQVVHDEEPGTTFWKRLGVSVMSLLPIESLL